MPKLQNKTLLKLLLCQQPSLVPTLFQFETSLLGNLYTLKSKTFGFGFGFGFGGKSDEIVLVSTTLNADSVR